MKGRNTLFFVSWVALVGAATFILNSLFTFQLAIDDDAVTSTSSQKQTQTNDKRISKEDYCLSDGSVCVYHNICYGAAKGSWFTSASPMDKSPLLNDMNYTKYSDSNNEAASRCNEKFVPQSRPYPSKNEFVYQEGTTYLVCCWVNHFGHILLQMFVSAVHALDKIGAMMQLRTNSINFLVDNRASSFGSKETVLSVFEFLTKKTNKVQSLQALEEKAKEDGKDNICFEELIVGMLYDDLVHGGPKIENMKLPAPHAENDMLQPLREHLENNYPLTKEAVSWAIKETKFSPNEADSFEESPPECTITFLRRKFATRTIGNFDDVINTLVKEVFVEPMWNIRTVSFDGPSLESQYLTVRSSIAFLSVSGTGSHLGMFLPEGGSSIEIVFNNYSPVKNKYICKVSPYLTCLSANSICSESNCKKATSIDVDIASFKEVMEGVKKDVLKKCNDAGESFLSEKD